MKDSTESKSVTTQASAAPRSRLPESLPEADTSLAAAPETQDLAKVETLLSEVDMADSHSILFFGSRAQEQLTALSDSMLEGVRNKDVGPAGDALSEMVAALRGFDVEGLDPSRKPSLIARLFGKGKPVVKFLQEYEEVRGHIDRISDELEQHKTRLLTDIASLDRLYKANLDYFRTLEAYIAAGEKKLGQLDEETIPALVEAAQAGGDMVKAQKLRDLRSARDDLERRVHDLRLTRQVAMQSLPSIRLVQENDKGLVNKINSTLVNTVPLWRQQLAQAITIRRTSEAAASVKAATDLTNELLQANAENLKLANAEARRQIERGVLDIQVIKRANQTLIDTIEESLSIADEGRKARAEATVQLQQLEDELRTSLSAARAREARNVGPQ